MLAPEETCEERFVISSSIGCDPLELTLNTTHPDVHNKKCSTAEEGFGSETRACLTGLRVYEGARLLAEFWRSSLWRRTAAYRASTMQKAHAIELGCGCGLAGIVFAVTHNQCELCLTDASEECVKLVQQSTLGMKLATPSRSITSEVLWWSRENVAALLARNSLTSFDVVMGSDLLYFMVDPVLLLQTCSDLAGEKGWIFLSHFMRLPRGQDKLRAAASLVGLRIASLPLEAVFEGGIKTVCQLGWGSLELVVLRRDGGDEYGDTDDHEVLSQELGIALQRYESRREDDRQEDNLLSAMMPDDYD